MADELTLPVTLPREFIALLGAPSQSSDAAREYIILGLFQEWDAEVARIRWPVAL